MITKYKACIQGPFGPSIDVVQVNRETEKNVWISGNRIPKNNFYGAYHDSWDEAWLELLTKSELLIDAEIRTITNAESRLSKLKREDFLIRGMKKP